MNKKKEKKKKMCVVYVLYDDGMVSVTRVKTTDSVSAGHDRSSANESIDGPIKIMNIQNSSKRQGTVVGEHDLDTMSFSCEK
mmetsp:Transcript_40114/g.44802  ORF Transcript_40114/g.44802 Transcript_40114/m.44802 type:complete len:82 (-) Transcript_40114:298-543(-)